MSDLEIVFEPLPSEALSRFVVDGVDLHNIAATGLAEWHPANFFLKSPRGEWLGGLLGGIWGGWLHIRVLWIAATVRAQGHGTRLLAAAEDFARDKGCRGVALETFSFQARPFYEKLGYEVFSTLDDYPLGHRRFFLKKALTGAVDFARP